jgi:TPR repeat protein
MVWSVIAWGLPLACGLVACSADRTDAKVAHGGPVLPPTPSASASSLPARASSPAASPPDPFAPCLEVGDAYRDGEGTARDYVIADQIYQHGCDGGSALACTRLRELRAAGRTVDPVACRGDKAKGGEKKESPGTAAADGYRRACYCGGGRACTDLGELVGESAPFFRQGCEHGDALGCYKLTDGVSDPKVTAPLYRQACEGGVGCGCSELGYLHEHGRGVALDNAKAFELYRRGCDLGDLLSCHNLGWTYKVGKGVAPDAARALELYKRACDGGEVHGCAGLGTLYLEGVGVARDPERAAPLFKTSCDGGDIQGCVALGRLYAEGRGVKKDYPHAVELLQAACAKDANACNSAGWVHYRSGRGARGAADGLASFERSCRSGSMDGCDSQAFALLNGKGAARDEAQALRIFEAACNESEAESCMNAGLMHLFGRATKRDEARARDLFKRGCGGAGPDGEGTVCAQRDYLPEECAIAGLTLLTGACGTSDAPKAATWLSKACRDGWTWACERSREYAAHK